MIIKNIDGNAILEIISARLLESFGLSNSFNIFGWDWKNFELNHDDDDDEDVPESPGLESIDSFNANKYSMRQPNIVNEHRVYQILDAQRPPVVGELTVVIIWWMIRIKNEDTIIIIRAE